MPYVRKRRRCPGCQQIREFARPTQKACSQRCWAKVRGSDWWAAHQRQILANRAARGYSRHQRLMKAAGMTDAQIVLVRRLIASARSSSWAMGRRAGFAEALGERGTRRGAA